MFIIHFIITKPNIRDASTTMSEIVVQQASYEIMVLRYTYNQLLGSIKSFLSNRKQYVTRAQQLLRWATT